MDLVLLVFSRQVYLLVLGQLDSMPPYTLRHLRKREPLHSKATVMFVVTCSACTAVSKALSRGLSSRRIWSVLMMVYNTQNHRVSGLCSTGILNTRKHVSETRSVSVFTWGEGELTSVIEVLIHAWQDNCCQNFMSLLEINLKSLWCERVKIIEHYLKEM
jgi:hypothetical protein